MRLPWKRIKRKQSRAFSERSGLSASAGCGAWRRSLCRRGIFLRITASRGDAHAGHWHRQVSLLSYDKVEEFNKRGADVKDGAFGENLVVEGLDFRSLPVGTRLYAGDVVLEMTQIGKECHSHCAIYKRMGECIMPREGVFAEVLQEGVIRPGDVMRAVLPDAARPFRAAVITLSDKGARGEREDASGPAAAEMLREAGYEVVETLLLPDEPAKLKTQLIRLADGRQVDLILTSGGTGFSLRDQTPEATLAVADRNAPGIAEAIRAKSLAVTDRAMLSRGGLRDTKEDPDCESARKPQGGAGEPGIYPGKPGPRSGYSQGERVGMCEDLKGEDRR